MPVIYQTSMEIPSFAGLNQSGDGYNMSPRYATEIENVDVLNGQFKPFQEGSVIAQKLGKPIGTLAYLNRRFGVDEDERELLVAFSDGCVYTKVLDGSDQWQQVYSGLSTDYNSYVTYEVNVIDGEEQEAPVDVLLFTNAQDGLHCLYGNTLTVVPVESCPYKLGVVSRSNERIWGTCIPGSPDTLVYSRPYDPFDWSADEDNPEDGGGEVQSPSWDGDSFVALHTYGSQLLAFKRDAIWKIIGTDPGEYVIREQYGTGAVMNSSIAVSGTYVYMLGYNGIVRYDGSEAAGFQQDAVRTLFEKRVNKEYLDGACAVMRDRTYCLALPIDGSKVNNCVLEYNTREASYTLRTNIFVKAFLGVADRVFYTSSVAPGRVYEMCDNGHALPVKWVSGYQDLGIKSSAKSSFLLYFRAEAPTPFYLTIGIQTDKKLKEKLVTVKPGKAMRVAVNVTGRYFRLILTSYTIVPYRIAGGIKIDLELDPD